MVRRKQINNLIASNYRKTMVAHTESEGRMEERDKRIASEHR